MKKPTKPAGTTIQNCTFTGVHWDAKAVETVQTVAQALLNLTQLFRSQGIEKPMVQIGNDGELQKPRG